MFLPEDRRPGAAELFEHPWLKENQSKAPLKLNFGKLANFSKFSKVGGVRFRWRRWQSVLLRLSCLRNRFRSYQRCFASWIWTTMDFCQWTRSRGPLSSKNRSRPWQISPNSSPSLILIKMGKSTTPSSCLAASKTRWFLKKRTWKRLSSCLTATKTAKSKRENSHSSSSVTPYLSREWQRFQSQGCWRNYGSLWQKWGRVHRLPGICGQPDQEMRQLMIYWLENQEVRVWGVLCKWRLLCEEKIGGRK